MHIWSLLHDNCVSTGQRIRGVRTEVAGSTKYYSQISQISRCFGPISHRFQVSVLSASAIKSGSVKSC